MQRWSRASPGRDRFWTILYPTSGAIDLRGPPKEASLQVDRYHWQSKTTRRPSSNAVQVTQGCHRYRRHRLIAFLFSDHERRLSTSHRHTLMEFRIEASNSPRLCTPNSTGLQTQTRGNSRTRQKTEYGLTTLRLTSASLLFLCSSAAVPSVILYLGTRTHPPRATAEVKHHTSYRQIIADRLSAQHRRTLAHHRSHLTAMVCTTPRTNRTRTISLHS